MLAPLLSVTIRLLFITALALAVPTTAAADATTVLWVPSGPAAVAEDEAVLRALSDAPPVDRVDRCLARAPGQKANLAPNCRRSRSPLRPLSSSFVPSISSVPSCMSGAGR